MLRVRVPSVAALTGAAPPQSLSLPFLPSSNALFVPAVAPGAVTLSLPFLPSANALFVPAAVPGAVTLSLPFLPSANALFVPIISLPSVPPDARIVQVVALLRAARVEPVPRAARVESVPRIILIK